MNANRLINMAIRMVLRTLMRRAGSGGNARSAPRPSKSTRQAAKLARRIGRM